MSLSDLDKLSDIFKSTMDSNLRESAEKQLEMIHKIIGFAPSLLRLVIRTDVEMSVRQAAAIYLKNNILAYWSSRKSNVTDLDYSIHENDKTFIRDSIIDAIVMSPELISVHLAVCINHIIKNDFPGKGAGIVEKISLYLQTPDYKYWMGALMALYQLVKVYEYKNQGDRGPLNDAMAVLLPIIHSRCVQLLPENSEHSVLIQKQIMKIFHAFTQYLFPLNLINREMFTQWMEVFRLIIERPVPDSANQVPVEERSELCWWKCKKWVLHNLSRIFERYGSPGNVTKEYKEFAEFYIKNFSPGIIALLMELLQQHGSDRYVDPRVLQLTLTYFTTAVNHAFTWKLINPHMMYIVQNIIFPLMSFSDQDKELWTTDPHEYIRIKFDVFEDYVSPITAAQKLLHSCSEKRKSLLQKIMSFVVQVLNDRNSDARMKDGGLHMVGTVADLLLKKAVYKDQMEDLLVTYVFPYFHSTYGFLRARACWVMIYFSETRFSRESNLVTALQSIEQCLLNDKELPVKIQAAICLQAMATSQEKVQKLIENNITAIAFEILNIIRETENEDLASTMQKMVCFYPDQLMPIAVEMTQHLEQTFYYILDSSGDDDNGDKALTAMGVLNTIDAILTVNEDQKEIMSQLEPIVLRVILKIYQEELMDLYEEALTLICTMNAKNISQDLWKIYELMYQVFKKDAFDYFGDMMPALHNFITVDPESFISNRNRILAMYDMCKTVMNGNADEEAESYAAKLLECMILQFKGQIDDCIRPFVELVLTRLTREVQNTSLKIICLQVIIAAFYYNSNLLLNILADMQPINSNQSLFSHFVQQWIIDTRSFMGLHDRKMCVLGLITLISLPPDKRVGIVNEIAPKLISTILNLFEGLKLAYQSKATAENQEDSDSEEELEDEEREIEALDDDQDHISTHIEDIDQDLDDEEDSYTDDEDTEYNQTALESYNTILDLEDSEVDEYVAFKEVLEQIQRKDPSWYNALMSPLSVQEQKAIEEVFVLANQRKAAAESRKIEKLGGYMFHSQTVPSSFNFGGTPIV